MSAQSWLKVLLYLMIAVITAFWLRPDLNKQIVGVVITTFHLKAILIQTRETINFQQSRLFIKFLNGHPSEESAIDFKYIKMTRL